MIDAVMQRELDEVVANWRGRRVLVVGDVMLDEYIWGGVRRISPEAPVPVVELQERTWVPGGAGNAAANAASLGAVVELVGVIGADEPGQRLAAGLAAAGVDVAGLVVDADRPTTTKTRIMARQQQLLRLDHEDRRRVNSAVVTEVLRAIDRRLPEVDAVIVADYDKGLVFGPVLRGLLERAAALGTPVVVDPKDSSVAGYRGATLLKPNLEEAGRLVGKTLAEADVDAAGRQLLAEGQVGAVLITRGAGGMTLFERGLAPLHLAAEAREVRDVTGAGDTVTATLAVALAAGASLEQATRLASCAAGIVVGKTGTAVVTHPELAATIHGRSKAAGGNGTMVRGAAARNGVKLRNAVQM